MAGAGAAAEAVTEAAVDGQDLEDAGRGRIVPGGSRMAAEPTAQLNHVHRPGRVAVAAETAGPPGCTQRCPDPLDGLVDPVRLPGGLPGVGEDIRWWQRRAPAGSPAGDPVTGATRQARPPRRTRLPSRPQRIHRTGRRRIRPGAQQRARTPPVGRWPSPPPHPHATPPTPRPRQRVPRWPAVIGHLRRCSLQLASFWTAALGWTAAKRRLGPHRQHRPPIWTPRHPHLMGRACRGGISCAGRIGRTSRVGATLRRGWRR